MSDAAARKRALDPTRSFIVQAPAGSGKTELLTQRYLRLLATVEHPEQILAITFTRKAAAEMRNRILLSIEAAAAPPPDSPHKLTTWELARAVRAADVERNWRLSEHPSRLRIQTIDALNSTLARRLPILAGTGSALEPSEDPWPLYGTAVRRLIERLGEGSKVAQQLESLIVHLGNRTDMLAELICELLAKRDQWLHQIVSAGAHQNLRAVLEQTLQGVIKRHLETLCGLLDHVRRRDLWELTVFAASNLREAGGLNEERRLLLDACTDAAAVPGPDSGSLDAWLALASVFLKKDGSPYQTVTKKSGFPTTHPEQKQQMLAVLADLAQQTDLIAQLGALRTLPRAAYSQEQWAILDALLGVLPVAVAELQLVFQAQGQADYIEAALRALQALGTSEEPTDLALAFDYRLQHLLVDEFQDTSFGQLDLLERLTAGWTEGDGRTLFCVGDPMQSIYRFRQAEVGLFLQLQRQGLRNVRLEPLQLTSNFRSTRPIIEWVNRVFPNVLSPTDNAEHGAVRYSPSVAALPSTRGGVKVHASFDNDEMAEARQVVKLVRKSLAEDPQATVAVLVTARSHVGLIATELHAASIDFQAIEIEALLDRPVVQDLTALTRALVHLADRTAWLAVLRAPWCGLTLNDLHAIVDNNRASTINELLTKALESGENLSPEGRERVGRVRSILQAALAQRGRLSLRDWVERTWNALGGPATLHRPQDLDDADAYLRRLDQIESAGDLEDVARLEEQLDRLFARPRPENRARVEVMTIHKAKGLEFDVVILPALNRWIRGEGRELMRWTRIPGDDGGIVFAPIKAEGADPDPMYRWIELLERERSARERGRLLYVAATRAKRVLHLLGTVRVKETDAGTVVQEPRHGSMLRLLWPEVKTHFESVVQSKPQQDLFAAAPAPHLRVRRLPLQWQPPAADVAVTAKAVNVSDLEAKLEFDWASQTARHIGTLVHRELDRLVRAGRAQVSTDRARLCTELAELGVPPDRCDAAAERVVSAIAQTLADERGRWLLGLSSPLSEAESELALSGVFQGEIVSGVIDRTFVDERGVRWIVDFKTGTHEGGGLEQFLAEEVHRYRDQLQRYARLMRLFRPDQPVRAALYFPLMKQWREVPVS
ncbi:UvrD-helicase domain-containing protein [Steroidobacter sp. S1-65]|uniref:DNA 3'-5' helicase n=1 Tax=Steroidobacter gossypii TaxID=2805490 RepID=A0ABS1WX79_9GAMM|nr:UvrD-helicase domain-containing protein [Steroidobacter gossypii]MBM0105563.1 UvrD-helicase domain-containing protein [Steroidobacter gossypii]